VDWKDSLQYVALTHVGMRRSNNQDSHSVLLAESEETWLHGGHIFLVADGMGGHAGGEIASKQAAESIPHLYRKYRDQTPPEALLKAIAETNSEINRRGNANIDFRDMGTTLSSFVMLPQGVLLAHVGDSRIYRLRGDVLHQLTFDHSVDWELRAAGHIQPGSELAAMVPKNQITRSLGPNPNVQIDLEGPYATEIGDTFLSCSDGLIRKVDDDEMAAILASLPPREAAQALIDLTNLRGGPDNITVIIAKVVGVGMTAAGVNAPPLSVQSGQKPQPVHPALWLVPVVCFMASLILSYSGFTMSDNRLLIAAGVALLGALVGLGIAFSQGGGKSGRRLGAGQRLGRGPYIELKLSEKLEEVLNKLFATTEDIRAAADEGEWEIDWQQFNNLRRSAEQARQAGDWQKAVRDVTRVISFLFQEVRNQSEKKASDSAIEY
jgi:PPM family protein phosphatase